MYMYMYIYICIYIYIVRYARRTTKRQVQTNILIFSEMIPIQITSAISASQAALSFSKASGECSKDPVSEQRAG